MKTTIAVMTALLLGASGAVAGGKESAGNERPYFSTPERCREIDLKKACQNYVAGLKSGNDGVVESTLAHVIRMKMCRKTDDFCDVKAVVDGLAVAGPTPGIRYKAYLASLVLDNPAWFSEECDKEYAGPEELFTSLAKRLDQTLLGSADRRYARPE